MINFHNKNKSDVTILSHPSDHMFDSDIIDVDSKNSVRKFYFKPQGKLYQNYKRYSTAI